MANAPSNHDDALRRPTCERAVFGATICLGAFLLFQIQPLISKILLPWFGGSPAVWTTCMMFFQLLLLGGYWYADRVRRISDYRRQALVHGILLLLACATLPISRAEQFRPLDSSRPIFRILACLGTTVGATYFVLAATGPLVQSWHARAAPQRSPYRLYALSNLGSLAALVTYPVLFEPFTSMRTQSQLWSLGFVVYAAMMALLMRQVAWQVGRTAGSSARIGSGDGCVEFASRQHTDAPDPAADRGVNDAHGSIKLDDASSTEPLTWKSGCAWFLWPALASVTLLAVTHQICQNIAVIPFLWIAPLCLYLLSFVLCFDSDRWYVPRFYGVAAACSLIWIAKLLLAHHFNESAWYFEPESMRRLAQNQLVQIASYLVLLFCLSMVAHGEVVRARPQAGQLTRFYLAISAGGAWGGILVSLICPLLFSDFAELNVLLALSLPLTFMVILRDARDRWFSRPAVRRAFVGLSLVTCVMMFGSQVYATRNPALARVRSFFGVMTVTSTRRSDSDAPVRRLYSGAPMHGGATLHGYQDLSPARSRDATTYYGLETGVGLALRRFPARTGRRVGIVGLGIGTLATYGRPGDVLRFYELNPDVERLARSYFLYLEQSQAQVDVALGDGRLLLALEPPQQYDMLVIDAFTGDTIPTHLLTREAFAIYLEKQLRPDGLLAVHVSNRYLDLTPPVARLAAEFRWPVRLVHNSDGPGMVFASDWLLITRNAAFWQDEEVARAAKPVAEARDFPLWTDGYNNLFQLLLRGKPRRPEFDVQPRLP